MSETTGTQSARPQWLELFIKAAVPILTLVVTAAVTLLWSHEGRLVVLEIRNEADRATLGEIKTDVKKLLEAR